MTAINHRRKQLLNTNAASLPATLRSISDAKIAAQGQTYLDIAAQFNKAAPNYDDGSQKVGWKGPKITIETAKTVATAAFFQKALNVLDFGTGTGEVGQRLKKFNEETQITGVDVAKNMLDIAQSKGRIDRAFLGDQDCDGVDAFEHFANGEFDAVFACGVLDFIHQSKPLIAEFARVVKPGGIIAFTYEPVGSETTNNHGIKSLRHDPEVLTRQFINACNENNSHAIILAETVEPSIYTTWGKSPRAVRNNIFVGTLSR